MMNRRILPLFALLFAVGIFFAYVHPTWSVSIAATKAAIASDNEALDAASAYTARENALLTARNAIDPANLAKLEVFLPDSVDNVGLILDLNALAARSGLSISNIDVSNPAPVSNTATAATASQGASTNVTGSIDLSLSAVGTYSALQTFLAGVEKSERLLDVRDIIVKGSDTGVYIYQMKLRLYWLR